MHIGIMSILKHWRDFKVGADNRHLFAKLYWVFNKEKKRRWVWKYGWEKQEIYCFSKTIIIRDQEQGSNQVGVDSWGRQNGSL